LSRTITKEEIRIVDARGLEVPFSLSKTDHEQIEIWQGTGVYYLISNNEHIKFVIL
jgi:hypothetical protein